MSGKKSLLVDKSKMPLAVGIAFVAFTTQFGGGFASGAQIYQYFINYGIWGLILPVLSQFLLAFFFWYGLRYAFTHKVYDYRSFGDSFYGKSRVLFSNLYEITYLILIATATSAAFATGGSTNCVIHTCAIAHEIGIPAKTVMGWFEDYGTSVPLICRINPASKDFDAQDFYHAGGIPEVQKQLKSILFNDCMTVTGRSIGENAAAYRSLYPKNPEVITSLDSPFSTLAGLAIMHGNLAPDTAVAKPAAIAEEVRRFEGTAICFAGEDAANEAIGKQLVKPGHVVVVRYAGPKGAPGMPEMFKPMKLLYGQGLNKCTALITDGRFSGTNNGCFVGHISPEAASGGPIALIEDGDRILIDVVERRIELLVSDEELERRRAAWSYTPPPVDGYLARYARDARSADQGGILE